MFFVSKLLKNSNTTFRTIFWILFFALFFTTSCNPPAKTKHKLPLTFEEVKDLEYFLNLLFFENHAAFVVFGSKPISEMTLVDTKKRALIWEEKLANMAEEERRELNIAIKEAGKPELEFRRNPYMGWLAWEKIKHRLNESRFLINITPEAECSYVYNLQFVDIAKTAIVLAEHYDYFKKISDMDFDPFAIVYELKNEQSIFWNRVFQIENHVAKGLLFGYGKKNALMFDYRYRHTGEESAISKQIISIPFPVSFKKEVKNGQANVKNFTIPRFGAVDNEYVLKYENEKKEIESYYRGRNILDTTLSKLLISD